MGLSRRDLILKYIVDYYIKTAQPVGSHTLIEEYNLPYSSLNLCYNVLARRWRSDLNGCKSCSSLLLAL